MLPVQITRMEGMGGPRVYRARTVAGTALRGEQALQLGGVERAPAQDPRLGGRQVDDGRGGGRRLLRRTQIDRDGSPNVELVAATWRRLLGSVRARHGEGPVRARTASARVRRYADADRRAVVPQIPAPAPGGPVKHDRHGPGQTRAARRSARSSKDATSAAAAAEGEHRQRHVAGAALGPEQPSDRGGVVRPRPDPVDGVRRQDDQPPARAASAASATGSRLLRHARCRARTARARRGRSTRTLANDPAITSATSPPRSSAISTAMPPPGRSASAASTASRS